METLFVVLIAGLILAGLVGFLAFFLFFKKQKFTYSDTLQKGEYRARPLQGKITIKGRTNYPFLGGKDFIQANALYYKNIMYNIGTRDANGNLTFIESNGLNPLGESFTLDVSEGDTLLWKVVVQITPSKQPVMFPIAYTIQSDDIGSTVYLTDDNVVPEHLIGNLKVEMKNGSTPTTKVGVMALLYGQNTLPARVSGRCFCDPTFTFCENSMEPASFCKPKIAWLGQRWLTTLDPSWSSTNVVTLTGGGPDKDGNYVIQL